MILDIYILARFARSLLMVAVALFLVFLLVEVETHVSRFQDTGIPVIASVWLAVLKSTSSLYDAIPIVFSLAALLWSFRLSSSSELVATRAAGRSGVIVLMVPAAFAFVCGMVGIVALNPVVVAASLEYQRQFEQYDDREIQVRVTEDKLVWLRHPAGDGQIVMSSRHLADSNVFRNANFFVFGADGIPNERYRYLAEKAVLEDRVWILNGVRKWRIDPDTPFQDSPAEEMTTFKIGTELTPKKFRENFLSPDQIPVLKVLDWIAWMESSGLEAHEYKVYLHMEFAKLLLLPAMVLIGAGFTLRPSRIKPIAGMVAASLFSGLAIFLVRNFSRVFGENGEVSFWIAAWFPATAAMLLSLGLLLYLEDG